MPTTHTDPSSVPEAAGERLLCLVPDDVDSPTAKAFHEALRRAGRGGSVVLYDRSLESYRPDDDEELLLAGDSSLDEVAGLAAAREAADAAGVELLVWRSTTPSIGTGIVAAIQQASIGVVVVPESGQTESLGDLFLGSGTGVADAIESVVDKPLVTDAGLEIDVVTVGDS